MQKQQKRLRRIKFYQSRSYIPLYFYKIIRMQKAKVAAYVQNKIKLLA